MPARDKEESPAEAELLEKAAALGLEIPAERRADVGEGAKRLSEAVRLLHDFLPPAATEGRPSR